MQSSNTRFSKQSVQKPYWFYRKMYRDEPKAMYTRTNERGDVWFEAEHRVAIGTEKACFIRSDYVDPDGKWNYKLISATEVVLLERGTSAASTAAVIAETPISLSERGDTEYDVWEAKRRHHEEGSRVQPIPIASDRPPNPVNKTLFEVTAPTSGDESKSASSDSNPELPDDKPPSSQEPAASKNHDKRQSNAEEKYDFEDELEKSGIKNITDFTPSEATAKAIEAYARMVSKYPPLKIEAAKLRVKERLRGEGIKDFVSMVNLAFKTVRRANRTERVFLGSWEDEILFDDNGKPMNCPGNVLAAFKREELKGILSFDVRFGQVIINKPPPWDPHTKCPRPWESSDNVRALAWFPRLEHPIRATKEHIKDATSTVARNDSFDSFLRYLESVEWDGHERLDKVMPDYCGAKRTLLNGVFFRKWMISVVARAYEPGCKADYMLVLVGEQGLKKSTFFRVLLPGHKYLREGLPKGGGKDSLIALQGPVIVEDAEMSFYGNREVSAIKAFLTVRDDKYRAPWDLNDDPHPRRVVFAGSCNEQAFLHDVTGGRRFWPITITKAIQVDEIAAYRDQLWAEARARYLRGEQWYLNDNEENEAHMLQEEHREIDPIEEALQKELRQRRFVSPSDYSVGLIADQLEDGYVRWIAINQAITLVGLKVTDKASQYRVANALRSLEWIKHPRERIKGLGQVTKYVAPEKWQYDKDDT
jgi:predicted P-loop ATPase